MFTRQDVLYSRLFLYASFVYDVNRTTMTVVSCGVVRCSAIAVYSYEKVARKRGRCEKKNSN